MNLMKRASIALVALACIAAFPAHAQLLTKFGPVTGVMKGTAGNPQTALAVSSDIAGLWTDASCVGGALALLENGHCGALGVGSVTSIQVTVPTPFTATGCTITTSGVCGITWTTGQTANQFLATPNGTTGPVGLRSIVAADIPTLNQNTTGTSALATSLAGGLANQLHVQTAAGVSAFVTAPVTGGTALEWNGSAFIWATPSGTGCAGANPTASIGLTAVNGSASSCVRSDGAPALSQAIAPTWTNAHIFAPSSGIPVSVNDIGNSAQTNTPIVVNSNNGAAHADYGWDHINTNFAPYTINLNNTPVISIASSGGVSVAAPATGNIALSLQGAASSAFALQLTGPSGFGAGLAMVDGGTGGRNYSLFSGGVGACTSVGQFTIYDNTAGACRLTIASTGAETIGTTSGVALTINGVSGQNVLNVTNVTGQGANISFFGNGGTQNWDVGGAIAATHMQIYDVTAGVTALDVAPSTDLVTVGKGTHGVVYQFNVSLLASGSVMNACYGGCGSTSVARAGTGSFQITHNIGVASLEWTCSMQNTAGAAPMAIYTTTTNSNVVNVATFSIGTTPALADPASSTTFNCVATYPI